MFYVNGIRPATAISKIQVNIFTMRKDVASLRGPYVHSTRMAIAMFAHIGMTAEVIKLNPTSDKVKSLKSKNQAILTCKIRWLLVIKNKGHTCKKLGNMHSVDRILFSLRGVLACRIKPSRIVRNIILAIRLK